MYGSPKEQDEKGFRVDRRRDKKRNKARGESGDGCKQARHARLVKNQLQFCEISGSNATTLSFSNKYRLVLCFIFMNAKE